MALTARQRNKLPRSAFVYAPRGSSRSQWKYPVPTKAQARRAGISESSRVRTARAAVSYSARKTTMGSQGRVSAVARTRAGVGVTRARVAGTGSARRRG
jgi:hypothetical protein